MGIYPHLKKKKLFKKFGIKILKQRENNIKVRLRITYFAIIENFLLKISKKRKLKADF